jgi:uncharacterized protein (TIGR02996 family)
MSEEAAFLNAILANPDDNATRLVYADWLAEQNDPRADVKAAFLRDTAILMTPKGHRAQRRVQRVRQRLHEAARKLPGDWLAVVSRVAIEACATGFEVRCPKRWEKLVTTADVKVRSCTECQQSVYYCTSMREARDHALSGECVAVDLGLPRTPHDLQPRRMLLGRIAPARHPR